MLYFVGSWKKNVVFISLFDVLEICNFYVQIRKDRKILLRRNFHNRVYSSKSHYATMSFSKFIFAQSSPEISTRYKNAFEREYLDPRTVTPTLHQIRDIHGSGRPGFGPKK